MSVFKILIGKTITSVKLDKSPTKKYIVFYTSSGEKLHFETFDVYEYAKTYINCTTGLSNLIGQKVELVHDSNLCMHEQKREGSYNDDIGLSIFTVNLMTLKGTFTIDYRTIHDGIDDGYMILSFEDSIVHNNVIKFERSKKLF